jgi:hypothetical protein
VWTLVAILGYAALVVAVAPLVSGDDNAAQMAASGGIWKQAVEAGIYDDTWAAGLHQLPMSMASGLALLLFASVAAYVFAREYKDRTMVQALTTPVRREYVVLSKMVVLAVWLAGLAIFALAAHIGGLLLTGLLTDMPTDFGWTPLFKTLGDTLLLTFMLYLTMPVFAWLAVWGRGYLRPMLAAIVIMGLGNSLVATDVSPYFPWNMPLHAFGASWMPIPPSGLVAGSWVVAGLVFLVGLAGTMWRIDRADVR